MPRLGLGHLETLLEGLDNRNVVLTNTTLSDMQAVDIAGTLVVDGASTFSGGITSNYLDFATGNLANLTETPVTPNDAALDAVVAGDDPKCHVGSRGSRAALCAAYLCRASADGSRSQAVHRRAAGDRGSDG